MKKQVASIIHKSFIIALMKLEIPSNEQLSDEFVTLQTRLQNILQETDVYKIDEFAKNEKLLSENYNFARTSLLRPHSTRNKEGLPPEDNTQINSSPPLNLENDIEVIKTTGTIAVESLNNQQLTEALDKVPDKKINSIYETIRRQFQQQPMSIKDAQTAIIQMFGGIGIL